MGMTLDIEQKLERYGLVDFYNQNQNAWQENAQDAYDYTSKVFDHAQVRPDDLAKTLRPAVEIDKGLQKTLDAKKLSQNYWIDYFTTLVVDRTWDKIRK
jgi:hypothetical protein